MTIHAPTQTTAPDRARDVALTIAGIFAEQLGLPPGDIGEDTSFFEAGGDSLATVEVTEQIGRAFAVEFSLIELFEEPTPRGLAAALLARYLA